MIHQITYFKVDGCNRIFETLQEAEAQERQIKLIEWYVDHPIWASRSGDVDWGTFEQNLRGLIKEWLLLNMDELREFLR